MLFLFFKIYFLRNYFCIFLILKKLVNEKYFPVKEKFSLVFIKVFFHFLKIDFKKKKLSKQMGLRTNKLL